MKMKRIYRSPKMEIVDVKTEGICDWIGQTGATDDFAKEQKIEVFEEQEESLPVDKNIWEDDEE